MIKVVILLGLFAFCIALWYVAVSLLVELGEYRSARKPQNEDDFKRRVVRMREKLADLLGAPGVTDTAELDRVAANWVGSPHKNIQLAGLTAAMLLVTTEKAQFQAKRGGWRMLYAGRNLALVENLLESLKVQIENLEPQQ